MSAVAALVIAAAPVPGEVKRGLEPRLGPRRCAALQELLIRRAAAWAAAVAPGRAFLAAGPGAWPAHLDGTGVVRFAQDGEDLASRLSAAAGEAGARAGDGPLLCASVDVPVLGAHHARAALADLQAGCDVAFGPSNDGGCYLLGLSRPELPAGLAEALGGARRPEIIVRGLALSATGMRVGLLRSERELHTAEDADALLADPAAPAEVRAVLAV